jgi:paraquat-inducible protein B
MDESRGYFKLGLFVLVTMGILAGCVIALGAHLFTHTETVQVETVINESVAGLEPGSAVKYRGVVIGQVSQITFADAKYGELKSTENTGPQLILVEMSMDPEKFKPLTVDELRKLLAGMVARGLRVQLSRSLLSGVTVIEINYVDPKLYPSPTMSWTPTALFIPSAPSPMTQVVGGMEKLVAQLNESDIPGVIHHIDGLVGDVDKTVSDLQLAALREKAGTLVDELRGSNQHLSESLRDLRDLLASQNDNIRVIVNNIRDLTEDARNVVDDLKQNPSRLILGSPPPRTDPGEHP